jgi:hypothetical protein
MSTSTGSKKGGGGGCCTTAGVQCGLWRQLCIGLVAAGSAEAVRQLTADRAKLCGLDSQHFGIWLQASHAHMQQLAYMLSLLPLLPAPLCAVGVG